MNLIKFLEKHKDVDYNDFESNDSLIIFEGYRDNEAGITDIFGSKNFYYNNRLKSWFANNYYVIHDENNLEFYLLDLEIKNYMKILPHYTFKVIFGRKNK